MFRVHSPCDQSHQIALLGKANCVVYVKNSVVFFNLHKTFAKSAVIFKFFLSTFLNNKCMESLSLFADLSELHTKNSLEKSPEKGQFLQ